MNKKDKLIKKQKKMLEKNLMRSIQRYFQKRVRDKKRFLSVDVHTIAHNINRQKYIAGNQWKKFPLLNQQYLILFNITSISNPITFKKCPQTKNK